jgi:hypothetical protein
MNQPVVIRAVGTHRSAGRHGLVRVAALLLLLTHQAAAGIVCLCHQEFVMRPANGEAAHHSAATSHSCHSEPDEVGTVAESGGASVVPQSVMPPGVTGPRCQMQAQPEFLAALVANPIPLPALIQSTPAFLDAAFKSVPAPSRDHYPRRSRPLYVTQSSYLI